MATLSNPSKALYYPYIVVPKSTWFTTVLLYWDEVGAIVPYEYIDNPERLGAYMVKLVREELVHQMIPGMTLGCVQNFDRAFLAFIDRDGRRPSSPKKRWTKVHLEKLQRIGDALCERGLARRDIAGGYSPWYYVEPCTATYFMAYLAGVLGQLPQERFSPITDQPQGLTPFVTKSEQRDALIRKVLLEDILPSPNRAIEPAKLAEFKNRYRDELRQFRRSVEDRVSELSVIPDEKDRARRSSDIARMLQEDREELVARMREQKGWPTLTFGALCAIVSSGLGVAKGVIDADWRYGVTGAGIGIAAAIYDAFRGSKVSLEERPLAYAALAHSELGQEAEVMGQPV